jgi:hypothetical protein
MIWRHLFYMEIKQKFPTLSESTIGNWIRAQEKILQAPKGSRRVTDYWLSHWPELEEAVIQKFVARREVQRLIGVH